MTSTVVFDLDKVLLGGDASTLFLRGRLRQRTRSALPLLLTSPLLLVAAAVPQLRALGALVMIRVATGGRDVESVAAAFRSVLTVKPEAAVADAIGFGDLDVVGSQAGFPIRRAMGESKVRMLSERGHPPPWTAVYSDSPSDLALFAGTSRPVMVNAGERAARQVER